MEKKITKKDYYETLKEIVTNTKTEGASELINFINKQISLIEAKSEKAKARNAEKKANGDELRDVVQAILTDEFQTIDAIVAQIEGEEITKAKVTARLTSLVNNGIAEKTDVKDDEGRKLKVYKLVA